MAERFAAIALGHVMREYPHKLDHVWTGDADASYRRHDAAYIELPTGRAFILVVFTQGRTLAESEAVLPAIAGKAVELVG